MLTSAPATADVLPPQVPVISPGGVNISDGTFIYTQTDLEIGTLKLERFHEFTSSPGFDADTMFNGLHVSNNFDIWVSPIFAPAIYQDVDDPDPDPEDPEPKQIMLFPQHYKPVVHIGAGASGLYRQDKFPDPVTIIPNNGEAEKGTLTYIAGVYTYTDQSGTIYTFNPATIVTGPNNPTGIYGSQRVASIAYPGGRIRTFSYNGSGQLKMVSDSTGYAIIFDWTSGNISAACGFDLSQYYVTAASTCSGAAYHVSYAYSGGMLASSTDALGNITTYSSAVTCIKPPGYATCKISNGWMSDTHLVQTMADGATWSFTWTTPVVRESDHLIYNGDNEVTVVDPAGKTSGYVFTGSTLNSATDANGNTTTYTFAGGSDYEAEYFTGTFMDGTLLTKVHFPEGNEYQQENAGSYHTITKQTMTAKPGTGLPDIVSQMSYNCPGGLLTPTCTQPVTKTDARGNVTNLDYFSWGGIKSEMQPAPTSGAPRPLKLYDYVQKYAYVKNAGGTLVAASAPVWLPNSETECQTVAGGSTATCDSAAPQVVTTYQYGANGTADDLLLRGKVVSSGGVLMRTCYGYDAQGNKMSETSARAGLTVCP